jgi:hypothetical protein
MRFVVEIVISVDALSDILGALYSSSVVCACGVRVLVSGEVRRNCEATLLLEAACVGCLRGIIRDMPLAFLYFLEVIVLDR